MRLLIIMDTNTGAFGGAEQNALALARAVASSGHQVVLVETGRPVVASLLSGKHPPTMRVLNLSAEDVTSVSLGQWRALLSTQRPTHVLLSKGWIDCTNWKLDLLMLIRREQYLAWEHHPARGSAVVPFGIGTFKQAKQRARRKLHSISVHRVACVSRAVQRAMRSADAAARSARVIYPGVDFDQYRWDDESRQAVRSRLGIPKGSVVIGTIGRLVRHKRNDLVLNAFAELRKRREDLDLWCVIAGRGPEQSSLAAQAVALGIADRTRVLGWQDEVVSIWNAIDIFPFPSEDEGLGMVIVESVACGCIPVTAIAGGMPEVLGDASLELQLVSSDVSAWSQKLEWLSDLSPDERTTLQRKVYFDLRDRFDASRQWKEMVDWIFLD